MKYILIFCLMAVALTSCVSKPKYQLIIISEYRTGDTTSSQEVIEASDDSMAYVFGLRRFISTRSIDKKYDVGATAVRWSLYNNAGRQVRELLTQSALATIHKEEQGYQDQFEKRWADVEQAAATGLMAQIKENQTIIKASITDGGFLCLAVINDGTSKDLMAIYYCRLAKEKGSNDIKAVKILDVYNSTFEPGSAYGKELGRAYCN